MVNSNGKETKVSRMPFEYYNKGATELTSWNTGWEFMEGGAELYGKLNLNVKDK